MELFVRENFETLQTTCSKTQINNWVLSSKEIVFT